MQPQTLKHPPACFTVACRHSLLYRLSNNKLPSATANISDPLLPLFSIPIYVFMHTLVTLPCFYFRGLAFWLQLFHKDHFWPDLLLDGCIWVPLLSATSGLMALLDIFWFLRVISVMCFWSAALNFLGWTLRQRSSTCRFLCASWKPHMLKPQSALKSLSGRDLTDTVELPGVLLLSSIVWLFIPQL